MTTSAAAQANEHMIARFIAQGALWSPALVAAFRATPRHRFLDRIYRYHARNSRWVEIRTREAGLEELRLIYSDRALVIRLSHRRDQPQAVPISSSSQPSLMATMLEDLQVGPGQRILEIGTGSGYNAALLAHATRPGGRVWSLDVDPRILSEAKAHLSSFTDRAVDIRHGDGRFGCPEVAPFDRIMVTAANPDLEPAWLEQLAPGGLLLAPLALAPGLAFLALGSVSNGLFEGRLTRPAFFLPLRSGQDQVQGSVPGPLDVESLTRVPSPWKSWPDSWKRRNCQRLLSSLAFWGLLHGWQVSYHLQPDGQAFQGLSYSPGTGACWLGEEDWYLQGPEGKALAEQLWQTFLEAGGPWPTEFRLRAGLGLEVPPGQARIVFQRQGPRCSHVWEMTEPRERQAWL